MLAKSKMAQKNNMNKIQDFDDGIINDEPKDDLPLIQGQKWRNPSAISLKTVSTKYPDSLMLILISIIIEWFDIDGTCAIARSAQYCFYEGSQRYEPRPG